MKIYLTTERDVHSLLNEKIGGREIVKNDFGKPYVRGNDIYFNLSHSGNRAALAISESPVGMDVELVRGRSHELLLKRFCEAERAEIASERDFLEHFTAREAYVKYLGRSIAELYNKLTFIGGKIAVGGAEQTEQIRTFTFGDMVLSVCGEGEIQFIEA